MAKPLQRYGVRGLSAAVVLALAAAAPARASVPITAANWDRSEESEIVRVGVMENLGNGFGGADSLTAKQANAAMAALAPMLTPMFVNSEQELRYSEPAPSSERLAPAEASEVSTEQPGQQAAAQTSELPPVPVARTTRSPVTLVAFDAMLADELGLSEVAAHVQAVARAAGLHPPSYFGTEVATRFLELDYEHAVGTQRFDLYPQSPITRATAAWSLTQSLKLSSWQLTQARQSLESFELPTMSQAQRQALSIAVSRIGYPYVWGGTTDNTADGLEHGGFDCSGFAWRVYKLSGLPWGNEIFGRTAAEQGGEIPKSQRLRASQLEPGDLLFFGSAHFNSEATEQNVIHEGIYLGDNWVIHSSGQGVYVLPLRGSWLGSQFAWGRRVIR